MEVTSWRMRRGAAALMAAAVISLFGTAPSHGKMPAKRPDCDRRCLQRLIDTYLKAVVAHDPSLTSLAPNAKVTKNGQDLGVQHGLWKTASADSLYRLYFADPEAGQVGFIGEMQENDAPVQVALRLKVDHHRITEAETIVSRTTSFAKPENFVKPLPILVQDVPAKDRVSRAALRKERPLRSELPAPRGRQYFRQLARP
jgi:hypothetical protein